MSNRLQYETSPYLLQHKDNPVDWYPWGEEAFARAKREDKPIFLSIGYSTCHWCHVLAHESFEDEKIAQLLNDHFICIKVDKEERPDIDSVYMAVCQAFTGNGGWPTSIFMTADQKPFFAGTYFPKNTRGGMIGMEELLLALHELWQGDRASLLTQSDTVLAQLNKTAHVAGNADASILSSAVSLYKQSYDSKYGGFGRAPKFPMPHNLLFLLSYYERYKDAECLQMAEHTLLQMYRGGLFDHIGFGFSRYSTDQKFLAPHFEKMLYDNALLMLAYCKAYTVTKKQCYLRIAEKTASYILREMTAPRGGFYSAQDADSEGEEGKFYLFSPEELEQVLGAETAARFNRHFDITQSGNFEGRNIPNLLKSNAEDASFENCLSKVFEYRKDRFPLGKDDKILTAWNGLMIAAMCALYLASGKKQYLQAALQADAFIQANLCEGDELFVSFRADQRGTAGFLDEYAYYMFAQLYLYRATLDDAYIRRAEKLYEKVAADFYDPAGGYYLYGRQSEELILRPKPTHDGALPAANTMLAYNLVRLAAVTEKECYRDAAEKQLDFLFAEAEHYPIGYAMFLTALLEKTKPPMKITVVADEKTETQGVLHLLPFDATVIWMSRPTTEYPLKNEKTTFYVCKGHLCLPPTNNLAAVIDDPKTI